MCWALGCFKSDLRPVYWTYSYQELTARLKLRMGEISAMKMQDAHALMYVASKVLGGSKPKERILTDVDEINRMLRGG